MRITVAYRWPKRAYGVLRCHNGVLAIDFGKHTFHVYRHKARHAR